MARSGNPNSKWVETVVAYAAKSSKDDTAKLEISSPARNSTGEENCSEKSQEDFRRQPIEILPVSQ